MPAYVRDAAGKKAHVRTTAATAAWGAELVDSDGTWNWYVDLRTGRYFVVAV